jgi:hypothetical protein
MNNTDQARQAITVSIGDRIEAQFTALRYVALRNRHVADRKLTETIKPANDA